MYVSQMIDKMSQTQPVHVLFIYKVWLKSWLHVSAHFIRPSSGHKSLSRSLYNIWYDTWN